MTKDKLNILIVDDHVMIRNGLRLMLENQHRFDANLFEATNGKEALDIIQEENLDVILLDVTMPEMDGLTALKKMRKKGYDTPVLMLTMHKDKTIIKQAFELGAHGYILKNSGLEELTKAIQTVIKNERYFSNEISQLLFSEMKEFGQHKKLIESVDNLSKREIQILSYIVRELSSKEIADKLNISVRTVEGHRKNLLNKLNIRSTIGLVKYAIKYGYDS